jgi:hypothetical protein
MHRPAIFAALILAAAAAPALAQSRQIIIEAPAGTYVLTIGSNGDATLKPAAVITPGGTTPAPRPTAGIIATSKTAYAKIDAAAEPAANRLPLAKKYKALAFGLRGAMFPVDKAAAIDAAMVADQVGEEHAEAYHAWQTATRAAINSTNPQNADDLADCYDQVADSLANMAGLKLLEILAFLAKLIELLTKLGIL